MGGRFVVAEGTHGDGLTWVVWARRHEPREGDLLSMIRVTDASGRILHGGGRAGPPLPAGHVLNVTSGGSDEGHAMPYQIGRKPLQSVVIAARPPTGSKAAQFALVVTPISGSGPVYAGRIITSRGMVQSILPVPSSLTWIPLPVVQNSLSPISATGHSSAG